MKEKIFTYFIKKKYKHWQRTCTRSYDPWGHSRCMLHKAAQLVA